MQPAGLIRTRPCSACLDEKTPVNLYLIGQDGDRACRECIEQIFITAIQSELNGPPRWGRHILTAEQFYPHALSQELYATYNEKRREYLCPVDLRVYCPWPKDTEQGNGKGKARMEYCNYFLGRRIFTSTDVLRNGGRLLSMCESCHDATCLACRECVPPPEYDDHTCIDLHAQETEPIAFEGLKRGKDYQICPNEHCGRRVVLSDGCNHMTCICGHPFCFICGETAVDGSDHWARRLNGRLRCPRFNQPGSIHAHFDVPDYGIPGLTGMPRAHVPPERRNAIAGQGGLRSLDLQATPLSHEEVIEQELDAFQRLTVQDVHGIMNPSPPPNVYVNELGDWALLDNAPDQPTIPDRTHLNPSRSHPATEQTAFNRLRVGQTDEPDNDWMLRPHERHRPGRAQIDIQQRRHAMSHTNRNAMAPNDSYSSSTPGRDVRGLPFREPMPGFPGTRPIILWPEDQWIPGSRPRRRETTMHTPAGSNRQPPFYTDTPHPQRQEPHGPPNPLRSHPIQTGILDQSPLQDLQGADWTPRSPTLRPRRERMASRTQHGHSDRGRQGRAAVGLVDEIPPVAGTQQREDEGGLPSDRGR